MNLEISSSSSIAGATGAARVPQPMTFCDIDGTQPASFSPDSATPNSLRLIVHGRGEIGIRRPHHIWIREPIMDELKKFASGPESNLVEIALERLIEDLKGRSDPASTEFIDVCSFATTDKDEAALIAFKVRKLAASSSVSSSAKARKSKKPLHASC